MKARLFRALCLTVIAFTVLFIFLYWCAYNPDAPLLFTLIP